MLTKAPRAKQCLAKIAITDTNLNKFITRTSTSSSQVSASRVINTESPFKNDGSWLKKLQYRCGVGDVNIFALRRASVFHYEACTDRLDPRSYFEHFHLPDTMFAFFRVVQLHVWMCQARSMMDGPEGRKLRNEITERMWQDMDTRLQRMEVLAYNQRKKILNDLLFHHQAAIFSYDEGLLSDDKTLANALWRTLFTKEEVNPVVLEDSVRYVRTQMNHLRSISSRDWCLSGKFSWAPFPPLINNRASYLSQNE
jgi:cytochrome b pre-mRNA-processing protein 3